MFGVFRATIEVGHPGTSLSLEHLFMFGGPSLLLLPIGNTVTFFDSSWAGSVFSHTKRYYSHDFCLGLENLRFCLKTARFQRNLHFQTDSCTSENVVCFTDAVLPSFFADIQTSLLALTSVSCL